MDRRLNARWIAIIIGKELHHHGVYDAVCFDYVTHCITSNGQQFHESLLPQHHLCPISNKPL